MGNDVSTYVVDYETLQAHFKLMDKKFVNMYSYLFDSQFFVSKCLGALSA